MKYVITIHMNKKDMREKGVSKDLLYDAYKLFFGSLTSHHRLRIINELRKKPMNVSELIERLGLEQSVVSHNLKRLRTCGFVSIERQGKYRVYSLNKETIVPLMEIIDKHMSKFCLHIVSNNPSLTRLKGRNSNILRGVGTLPIRKTLRRSDLDSERR